MITKLRALVATASVVLVLILFGVSPTQGSEEGGEFLKRGEPVLGLSSQELKELLGNPKNIDHEGCVAAYFDEEKESPVAVLGTAWYYDFEVYGFYSALSLCVVDGYVVAEVRNLKIQQGPLSYIRTEKIVNEALVEKAAKGELADKTQKERIGPQHSGKELEI